MIQTIALDFDGVILESADIKTKVFRELFRHHPDRLEEIIAYHVRNAGISRFRKFETIYRTILHLPWSEAESRRLGEEFSRLISDEVLRAPFVAGAERFLREFAGRLPLYVVSGTPVDELRLIVQARGLTPYFTGVFGSPELKPDILRSIQMKHQIEDGGLLFVGDGWSDLEGARAAGARFIGRTANGGRDAFAGEAGVPRVTDLGELLDRWEELTGEPGPVHAS